ncbi:MAG: YhcH/YjgK/YiaL family protein [Gemmiger sp.]|nr:YhcH/YjgK/YiaL family protein [Gemmiger sp.]
MLVDSFDYIACYKGLHPNLDTAIDWLNSHTLDALENGRTIIDGENVFVNVMDADLRDAEGAAFEYHRRYADLQIDLSGGEHWGWAFEGRPEGEFSTESDAGFASGPEHAGGELGEGRFVIFFPGELHKPSCKTPGCDHVRKAVVKILMK